MHVIYQLWLFHKYNSAGGGWFPVHSIALAGFNVLFLGDESVLSLYKS